MRLTERNPVVIGLVAVVVILAGTFAALTVKGDTFAPAYPITADFRDSAGLQSGDLVTIAGVRVGHVGSVKQDGNAVRVTLEMSHGVQVARRSTAAIKVATLLGRKEVVLTAPADADWADLYRKGDHISGLGGSPTEVLDVQSDAQQALATLDAATLDKFMADLTQVTAGKADQVSRIIDGLSKVTGTIDARSDEVGRLIDAANAVSGTVEARNRNLLSAIDNLDEVVANLDARRTQLTQLLESTEAAASRLSGLIGANRDKLTAVLTGLRSTLNVIDQHQLDLAQAVSYLAGSIQGFSSVGYSGPTNTPNTWANIFLVGVGPASGDPIFGCNGELSLVLTEIIGPDPVTNCQQYTGPVPGGSTSGAVLRGDAGPAVPASLRRGIPGAAHGPTASSDADSIDALLAPMLIGGTP